MTAKEYLSQARNLEHAINNKLAQVAALRNAATKATAILSGMPNSPTPNVTRMEDTIAKLVDLENEAISDMEKLVSL